MVRPKKLHFLREFHAAVGVPRDDTTGMNDFLTFGKKMADSRAAFFGFLGWLGCEQPTLNLLKKQPQRAIIFFRGVGSWLPYYYKSALLCCHSGKLRTIHTFYRQ